jgi:hypothetical protein
MSQTPWEYYVATHFGLNERLTPKSASGREVVLPAVYVRITQ